MYIHTVDIIQYIHIASYCKYTYIVAIIIHHAVINGLMAIH